MKLLIMQFSPDSSYFNSLLSKYSPQHPVLKRPQSVFLLNARDRVSHPYRTRGKTIVLYILIYIHNFTYLSVYSSLRQSVHPLIHSSMNVCLSLSLCLYVYPSFHPSHCLCDWIITLCWYTWFHEGLVHYTIGRAVAAEHQAATSHRHPPRVKSVHAPHNMFDCLLSE
jgi:hypothetical protein